MSKEKRGLKALSLDPMACPLVRPPHRCDLHFPFPQRLLSSPYPYILTNTIEKSDVSSWSNDLESIVELVLWCRSSKGKARERDHRGLLGPQVIIINSSNQFWVVMNHRREGTGILLASIWVIRGHQWHFHGSARTMCWISSGI